MSACPGMRAIATAVAPTRVFSSFRHACSHCCSTTCVQLFSLLASLLPLYKGACNMVSMVALEDVPLVENSLVAIVVIHSGAFVEDHIVHAENLCWKIKRRLPPLLLCITLRVRMHFQQSMQGSAKGAQMESEAAAMRSLQLPLIQKHAPL